jgi:dTDP-4-amino-4,6-dideoxygalactose transaminase
VYVSTWQTLSPAQLLQSHGEMDLPFPLNAPHRMYFYRARNAIYHLIRALRFQPGETVLVPAYHHGNEVRAIRAAGASIRFYPITRHLEPDLDALRRSCEPDARALFVIHYLGWPQPMKELTALCRERGMLLIEDCALALLSETAGRSLGSFGDYAVYCLYKTLPLPHGGLLVQNGHELEALTGLELNPCSLTSLAGRSAELMLQWLQSRSNGLGGALMKLKRTIGRALSIVGMERLPVGDTGFDLGSVNVGMSPWASWLLTRCDYDAIRRKRRENFLLLRNKLVGRATLVHMELEEGICPLFFPILVPHKRAAAEALWQRGIEAIEFWNAGDPEADGARFPYAQFLRDHLLELPIHQDVTPSQVNFMAKQVLDLRLHF